MTLQIRDLLLFEEKEYKLNNFILEPYFAANPRQRPFGNGGTALKRGYIADFSIKKGKLTVTDIKIFSNEFVNLRMKSIIREVFNGEKTCEWYSGLIRIDNTKGVFNEEKVEFTFEFLEFHKGIYIRKRVMNYFELQKFKINQYKKFKETDDFKDLYNRILKSNIGEYETSKIIMDNILEYIPKEY